MKTQAVYRNKTDKKTQVIKENSKCFFFFKKTWLTKQLSNPRVLVDLNEKREGIKAHMYACIDTTCIHKVSRMGGVVTVVWKTKTDLQEAGLYIFTVVCAQWFEQIVWPWAFGHCRTSNLAHILGVSLLLSNSFFFCSHLRFVVNSNLTFWNCVRFSGYGV